MFKYAHTCTTFSYDQYQLSILNQHVEYFLMSLINGLKSTNFGLDTLIKCANDIETLKNKINKESINKKWIIDSGGYSIIKGDIHPKDMQKFIGCYNYYLEHYTLTNCDYIMSLDIPVLLKYPSYNNVKYLREQNLNSNKISKEILDNNKELYNKYIFVWQFKTPKLYKIWNEVYDEYYKDVHELKHFAVGGQVGLRSATNIKFSSFIGPFYKVLNIIYNKDHNDTCILHSLGNYTIQDRFALCFLHKLFNEYYLKDKQTKVQITFDTINFLVSGFYRIRDLSSIIVENGKYIFDDNVNLVDKMHLLIEDKDALDEIKECITNIIDGKQIKNTYALSLLEVIKNQIKHQIIDDTIEKYDMVKYFTEYGYRKFEKYFKHIFNLINAEFPYVFENKLGLFLNNFQYIGAFHKWWENGRDENDLETMMNNYINIIGFPFELDD